MSSMVVGRSRVPAAGKVYWQQWVPVARGKGTCGPGIQRALGAAHSIPYPFSSLPRPSDPDLSRTRLTLLTALRLAAPTLGTTRPATMTRSDSYIERYDVDFVSVRSRTAGLT